MEYLDLPSNFQKLLSLWNDYAEYIDDHITPGVQFHPIKGPKVNNRQKRLPIDPNFFAVRQSVCVTGFNWLNLQKVKATLASICVEPVAIESLHVKNPSDVKDGALLVPKVILVASHSPGKKLIDDDGDQGQLDYIYDEICDTGADVFVVYLGLPRSIYKPMNHMVYHPRMIDLVFPQQDIIRQLAEDNLLITLVEGQEDFTFMQKNVIREWLEKPVGNNHPVYKAADYLSSVEADTYGQFTGAGLSQNVAFFSESEIMRNNGGLSWKREKKMEEKPKKKKKERKKLFKPKSKAKGYIALPDNDLMAFEEEEATHIEMNSYSQTSQFSQLSV